MATVLILFATRQQQTEKIANFIVAQLQSLGHQAQSFDVNLLPATFNPNNYDAIVAGAPVHIGGFPKSFKGWILRNADILNGIPSAFFSVCLGILQKNEAVQYKEREIVEKFLRECSWQPKMQRIFPGALTYSKYSWLMKRIMKKVALAAGQDTDLSRDYEFTDWKDVESFVKEFSHQIPASSVPKKSANTDFNHAKNHSEARRPYPYWRLGPLALGILILAGGLWYNKSWWQLGLIILVVLILQTYLRYKTLD